MPLYPIFIVEDNSATRGLLEKQLSRHGHESHQFATSTDFLGKAESLPPGLVILDIHLPGIGGLELLDRLSPDSGPFAVVVISGSADVDDAIGAFRRGAVHFVRKPYRQAVLLDAVVEAGEMLDQTISRNLIKDRAAQIHLSAREREVLEYLVKGQQSKGIAFELGISIRTVEMHRSKVLSKLGARSTSHAVAIAKGLALV